MCSRRKYAQLLLALYVATLGANGTLLARNTRLVVLRVPDAVPLATPVASTGTLTEVADIPLWREPLPDLMRSLPVVEYVPQAVTIRLRQFPADVPENPLLSSLPLIAMSDITWDGGACIPDTANPADGAYLGSSPNWSFAYDPTTERIFDTSDPTWNGTRGVTQLAIPALVLSSNINALNKMTYIGGQPTPEPTEGIYIDSANGVYTSDPGSSALTVPTALFVWGTKLCGTYSYFYGEADPSKPFFCRPKDMSDTGHVEGMRNLTPVGTDATKRMMLAGCASITAQWQDALGGPMLCSAGATFSVINTQSRGPSICTFDPDDMLTGSGSANCLIYYPGSHQTLGGWDLGQYGPPFNEMMDISTQITGCVVIKNTRTTLCVGTTGNSACYGFGLPDPADPRIGTEHSPGNTWCYDPTNSEHGNHGYPYDYRAWLIDTYKMAQVLSGATNPGTGLPWKPWEIIPYEFSTFTFPHAPQTESVTGGAHQKRIRGIQYNDTTQKLYIMQDRVCFPSVGALWRGSIAGLP